MKDSEVLRDEFMENLRDSFVSGFADGYKQGLMEATNAIHEIKHIDCIGWELIDDIEECLKQLPTVEEQKKGKMTNREYLDSLSNVDFANFIYSKLLKIGKEYNDSVLGIAHWLGLEKSKEKR